jgi:hypothetical protein
MRHGSLTWSGLAVAVAAAGLALAGCGSSSSPGPAGPAPPDLSTPGGFVRALQDFYSYRRADDAVALLADDYHFYPARPESIPFLPAGEMSWDYDQEKAILELLLVPERSTWIDQVLLEVHQNNQHDLGNRRLQYDATVELSLLIGEDTFVKGKSDITYVLEADANGDYHLVEEHETLAAGSALSVGELRAEAFADRTQHGG